MGIIRWPGVCAHDPGLIVSTALSRNAIRGCWLPKPKNRNLRPSHDLHWVFRIVLALPEQCEIVAKRHDEQVYVP